MVCSALVSMELGYSHEYVAKFFCCRELGINIKPVTRMPDWRSV